MLTFHAWLLESGSDVGPVYSDPANDDNYAQKGARSKYKGGQSDPVPGPFSVDPDDMFLTGNKRRRKKQQSS